MPKPKIIDLFAGVGGLSLGAARAGFDLSLAVEIDKHALCAHKLNFPNHKHSDKSVADYDGESLLRDAGLEPGELDGLIGGPPCQGFSVIGRQQVIDPRNDLFLKFFDLVAQSRPKFFVAENVLGILNSKYSEIRESALSRVSDEYVVLDPIKVKASDYGAPTIRERAFFIGYRSDAMNAISRKNIEERKVQSRTTVAEALHGLPVKIDDHWLTEEQSWKHVSDFLDESLFKRMCTHRPEGIGDEESITRYQKERMVSGCFGTRHSEGVRSRFELLQEGQEDTISRAIRLRSDGFCPTLRAGTGVEKGSRQAIRPIHPTQHRVITPREAARLQGFPDWFRFAPSKWHSFRQIGNSVSPFVAQAVLSTIMKEIQE